MKLAQVVGFTEDRQKAKVLTGIMPADQAISTVKHWINTGHCPDPLFPIVAAVGLTNNLREHRFKPTREEIEAATDKAIQRSEWEFSEEDLKQMAEDAVKREVEKAAHHKAEMDAAKAEVESLKAKLAELQEKSAATPKGKGEEKAK